VKFIDAVMQELNTQVGSLGYLADYVEVNAKPFELNGPHIYIVGSREGSIA